MVTVINPIVDFHHRVIIHAGRTPRMARKWPDAADIRMLAVGPPRPQVLK